MRKTFPKLTALLLTLAFALGVASPALAVVKEGDLTINTPGTQSSTWYKGESIPLDMEATGDYTGDDYITFYARLCPKGSTDPVWEERSYPPTGYTTTDTFKTKLPTKSLKAGSTYRLDVMLDVVTETGSEEGEEEDSGPPPFKADLYLSLNIKQLLAPTGLKAAPTTKSIPLTWNKATGATSYEIWRSVGNNTSFVKYKTVTANSFTDTSVKQGVWYYYKLFSVRNAKSAPDGNGNVDYYGKVTSPRTPVLKTALKLTAPGKPTGVKATAGTRQVTVTWTKASLATKYQVWRSTKKSSSFKQIATVTGTKYVNKSLKKGSRYYYRVKAVRVTKTGTKYSSVSAPALSGKVR